MVLAVRSVGPPGGQGTIIVIVLVGQSLLPQFTGGIKTTREAVKRKAKNPAADPKELAPRIYSRRKRLLFMVILRNLKV